MYTMQMEGLDFVETYVAAVWGWLQSTSELATTYWQLANHMHASIALPLMEFTQWWQISTSDTYCALVTFKSFTHNPLQKDIKLCRRL